MALQFRRAVRTQARLRLAVAGPSGSGKTYSALLIAKGLGGTIAVIDSERGSSTKYSGEEDIPEFDVLELDSFSPDRYIEAIDAAERAGYQVLIIDSLSHAWAGKEGVLEQVDIAKSKSRSNNAFTDGWRHASPMHNRLVDRLLQCRMDLIVTMRSKSKYILEDRNGHQIPKKVGMELVQRSEIEYEWDILGEFPDADSHNLLITKSRCKPLTDKAFHYPGEQLGQTIRQWLSDGAPVSEVDQQMVQRPTPDHIDGLIELATSLGIEREAFGDDMRRLMGTLAPMTRKYLLEHMTLEHYQQAWDAYQARLRAAIEQDLAEEDVPDPTPPQETTADAPASPQDDDTAQEPLPYAPEADRPTEGTPAYATAGEITALRAIAKRVKQEGAVSTRLAAYPNELSVPRDVVEGLKAQIKAGEAIAAGDA